MSRTSISTKWHDLLKTTDQINGLISVVRPAVSQVPHVCELELRFLLSTSKHIRGHLANSRPHDECQALAFFPLSALVIPRVLYHLAICNITDIKGETPSMVQFWCPILQSIVLITHEKYPNVGDLRVSSVRRTPPHEIAFLWLLRKIPISNSK